MATDSNTDSHNVKTRLVADRLAALIDDARRLPRSREASIVLTHLETAELWLGKASEQEG